MFFCIFLSVLNSFFLFPLFLLSKSSSRCFSLLSFQAFFFSRCYNFSFHNPHSAKSRSFLTFSLILLLPTRSFDSRLPLFFLSLNFLPLIPDSPSFMIFFLISGFFCFLFNQHYVLFTFFFLLQIFRTIIYLFIFAIRYLALFRLPSLSKYFYSSLLFLITSGILISFSLSFFFVAFIRFPSTIHLFYPLSLTPHKSIQPSTFFLTFFFLSSAFSISH